jgi:BlaI family penicillinase repressor
MTRREKPRLGPLENAVMCSLWRQQRATADQVRTALAGSQPLKDSTIRTVLRRLEEKGYVTHITDGRTYVYTPRVEPRGVATAAVRGIIDRFCDGSVEDLLVGMVDDEIVSPKKLRQLAERIGRAETAAKRKRG